MTRPLPARAPLAALLLLAQAALPAAEFHVSPRGHDSNPGTAARPFATLERARNAVRQLQPSPGAAPPDAVTVFLRAGVHARRAAFVLTREDSGTPEAPVVYRAYPGENAALTGAAEIPLADFTPVTDDRILDRVPAAARGKIRSVDLRKKGITDYGTLSLHGASVLPPYTTGPVAAELFVNGRAMTLARWPDTDYALVDTVIAPGSVLRNWMPDMVGRDDRRAKYVPPDRRENPPAGFAFTVADDRPARWSRAEDAWLFGYWYWDWSDQSVRVASIDPPGKVIRTAHASGYGVRPGQRFFAYNLLEELDAPGEWYLNRQDGVLYFFPPGSDLPPVAHLSLCTEPLVRFQNASHITLCGLSLGLTRGDGVNIDDGTGVVIERCDIGSLGGKAVVVRNGSRHTVRDCLVHDTGADGIEVTGGDRATLTPAGHVVLNNEVTRFSRLQKTYTPGITVAGVGNRVAHNLVHDAPHAAIHFLGNDHLIEFNEIHHVLLESDDAGAIYSGRRFTFWGNKIRHNFLHDIHGLPPEKVRFKKGALSHAVYLDDKLSGIEVTGNVFLRCNDATVIKGSDNRFEHNLVIDCRRAVWDMSKEPPGTFPEPVRYDQPDRRPQHLDPTVLQDILAVPYTSAIWREKYPDLATSLERTHGPWRVTIRGNVLLGTPPIETSAGMREHGRIADNHLLPDSPPVARADLARWIAALPARVPEFPVIPFDQIGLRGSVGPR